MFVGEHRNDLEESSEGDQAKTPPYSSRRWPCEALGCIWRSMSSAASFRRRTRRGDHLLGAQVQVAAGGFPAGDQVLKNRMPDVHAADDGDAL